MKVVIITLLVIMGLYFIAGHCAKKAGDVVVKKINTNLERALEP